MPDETMGPAEVRLRAVERRLERLNRDTAAFRNQLVALQQGIWDGWGDRHAPTGAAAVTPTPTPTGCGHIPTCTGALACTLYGHDSVYGSWTLPWDGANNRWSACIIVNFPGYTAGGWPAASNVALHIDFQTNGFLRIRYNSLGAGQPTGSTACTDPTNWIVTGASPVTIDSCVPFRGHYVVRASLGFKVFGDDSDAGVTVSLADTPF